jgi:hypothetical protein
MHVLKYKPPAKDRGCDHGLKSYCMPQFLKGLEQFRTTMEAEWETPLELDDAEYAEVHNHLMC